MPSSQINRVFITGNLTRDPELRMTPSGTPVCSMRLASNSQRRDAAGEWHEKPNYFDVVAWGTTAENCATYLSKGRAVAVDGRLEWREWEDAEGRKRQAVEIVGERIKFLGAPDAQVRPAESELSPDEDALEPAAVGAGSDGEAETDDIPF